jgi:hypothetical protein
MQRLLTQLAGRPFSILAVNVKESKSTAWRFRKLAGVSFTTLLDSSGEAAGAWDVDVYPTSYLIGAGGQVRFIAYGALQWDDETIRQQVETLLPDREARETPPKPP